MVTFAAEVPTSWALVLSSSRQSISLQSDLFNFYREATCIITFFVIPDLNIWIEMNMININLSLPFHVIQFVCVINLVLSMLIKMLFLFYFLFFIFLRARNCMYYRLFWECKHLKGERSNCVTRSIKRCHGDHTRKVGFVKLGNCILLWNFSHFEFMGRKVCIRWT